MGVHFALVCRPQADDVFQTPENEGYDFARIAGVLEGCSGDTSEVIDTTSLSDEERHSLYIDRAVAAAGNRYRVGRVFGSNRHPGRISAGASPHS